MTDTGCLSSFFNGAWPQGLLLPLPAREIKQCAPSMRAARAAQRRSAAAHLAITMWEFGGIAARCHDRHISDPDLGRGRFFASPVDRAAVAAARFCRSVPGGASRRVFAAESE